MNTKYFLRFLCIIALFAINPLSAQTLETANQELNSKSANCANCNIVSPKDAVDVTGAFTTTFSLFQILVAAPTATLDQTVIFPSGACAGDTVFIYYQNPENLGDLFLNGVTFTSFNNGTSNNDAQPVSGSVLLSDGATRLFKFAPNANYDRIQIRITVAVSTVNNLRIYYAQKATVRPTFTGNFTICRGESTNITANSTKDPSAAYTWYTLPTGGTPIFTGKTYMASPTVTTTYYVERCNPNNSLRTPVTVTVVQPPVSPTASGANICFNSSTMLTATAPLGAKFNWYSEATNGLLLAANATSYSTPILTQTDTFYVEASSSPDNCLSVARTPVIVNVSPSMPAPFASNDTICEESTASLIASFPLNATFRWFTDSVSGNLLSSSATYNPVIENSGTYIYWLESNLNSDNPDCGYKSPRLKVLVVAKPRPMAPTISGTLAVCSGTSATLTANSATSGVSFLWYADPLNGSPFFSGKTYNTSLLTSDTTFFVESVLNGCPSNSRTMVRIRAKIIPSKPTISGQKIICNNTNTSLIASSATNGVNFIWKDKNNVVVANNSQFNTPNLPDTTSYSVYSELEGCQSDTTLVTIFTTKKIQPPVVTCGVSTVNSIEYVWEDIPNNAGYEVSVDGESFKPANGTRKHTITGLNFGEVRSIRVRTKGNPPCDDSDPSNSLSCFSSNCNATSFITKPDFEICKGTDARFFISNISTPRYSVKWQGGPATTDTTYVLTGLTADNIISVEVIDSTQLGCPTFSKQIKVKINPNPTPAFASNKTVIDIDNPEVLFVDNTSGSNKWFWDFGDGSTSDLRNPTHNYDKDGSYNVKLVVFNSFNCVDSITKPAYIMVQTLPFLIIPNAFSPNGDNLNDKFLPSSSRILKYELKVFNEWGQELYTGNNSNDGWDGNFEGIKQQVGIYFYVINAKDDSNKTYSEKGIINLIR